MSLQSHINNLREKPEHVRKQVAFWYSFGFTAIIFAFWVASFTSIGDNTKVAVNDAVSKAGTPVQSLVASVGSFGADLREIVFGPKKIKYSVVKVTPGKR